MSENLKEENVNCNKILKVERNGNMRVVTYWLTDSIGDTNNYIDLLNIINSLSPQDTINIYINCPGGNCDTAFLLYDSLLDCNAVVNIYGCGMIASAATYIMLAGDNIYLSPHTYVMCHGYTWGLFGKCNEVSAQHEFTEPWMKEKFHDIYKDFLTADEISELLNGKDFWFTATEASDRITNARSIAEQISNIINDLTEGYKDLLRRDLDQVLDANGNIDEDVVNDLYTRLNEMSKIDLKKAPKKIKEKPVAKKKS